MSPLSLEMLMLRACCFFERLFSEKFCFE